MYYYVKEFIQSQYNNINNNNFREVFMEAASTLPDKELGKLVTMLDTIGIDTTSIRWEVFEYIVKDYVDYYSKRVPKWLKNKSEDWSRLDYMLEEISNLGFGQEAAKKYVLEHESELGLKLSPLEYDYGWFGSDDFDLGWFNKVEFDKEND